MMEDIKYGSQEIKIVDRNTITFTGINKIISFDDEEFLMESNMGNIRLLGNNLELLKLDNTDGNVKIKGKINSFDYIEGKQKEKSENILAKIFK